MTKRRPPPSRRGALAMLAVALVLGCSDASPPTGTGPSAALAISPRFALAEAPFASAPVDRVVLRAFESGTSELLGETDVAVDPNASQWMLALGIDLAGSSSKQAVVQLELRAGSSVEWSGRTAPFEVRAGGRQAARAIDVYRGPLDNLDVSSIEISGVPSQIGVGQSLQLTADVTVVPGSDASPVVFWASTQAAVASVTTQGATATVLALAPGTSQIIAGAGPAMDTLSVEVLLYPASVWVGGAPGNALDWSDPENWSPVGVPDTLTDVLIDVATFEPLLTEDVAVHDLTVVGDPTIDLGGFTLTVLGELDGDRIGGLTAVNGLVVVAGTGQRVDGGFDRLRIDADRALAGLTEVTGDLQLNGAALTIGGEQLTVGGNLDVDGANGRLRMQDPAGRVDVGGNATFSGASEDGFLTAGELSVAGDLTASSSSPGSFVSSATHATALTGSGAQSLTFSAPGPAGQRLNDVTIGSGSVATMASDATITGTVSVSGEWVVPAGTTVAIAGALTLQGGSTLAVDGTVTATGGCTNMGAAITGSGTHPCSNFNPGLGSLVAIAFDPLSRNLFVYDDFATVIHEYTRVGVEVLPTIPSPAPTSNDYDLDFMSSAGNVGGADVPPNTLLVINGEVSPGVVFAIDKNDGTVFGSIQLPPGNPVGGAFDAARGTLFVVDWGSDQIWEIELDTGTRLASFPVRPAGSPAFDVFYGDLASDPLTGNLMVVSSSQSTVRVLTPTGAFVKDIDVGIANMSGIGWDAATRTAWITATNGTVYQLSGLDVAAPTSRSTLNPLGQTTNWEARTSQTRTGSASILMYDDFTFLAGSTLQSVAWQGIYCREVAGAPAPVPVATSFTVSFHADLAGVPDSVPLYSETIPVAQAGETLDVTGPASCGVTPSTTWGLYGYAAQLAAPFAAAAGTRYWLSVVANLPSTDLYWGWRAGTRDNDNSLQRLGAQLTTYTRDRAFSLAP